METLEVVGLALAVGGDCVAAPQDDPAGKKVFVRDLIPGESALVHIEREEKNRRVGRVVRLTKPSPDRVSPPCPYINQCGGCVYQHIPIGAQRDHKRDMVATMLSRHAGIVPRDGVTLEGRDLGAYHYRRRVSLHLSRGGELGFYREGTGDVVDIERCLLAEDALLPLMSRVRSLRHSLAPLFGGVAIERGEHDLRILLRLRSDRPEDLAEITTLTAMLPSGTDCSVYVQGAKQLYSVEANGIRAVHEVAGRFSQVNEEGNAILRSLVVNYARPHTRATDFYAGSGNFSLPLARLGLEVVAVEADRYLVDAGRDRAEEEGMAARLTFEYGSCERYLPRWRATPFVVLDPPRSGAKILCERLSADETACIVYVSCNLPSFVRDARALCERGFECRQVHVVDMFAQTHHVETVAVFERHGD